MLKTVLVAIFGSIGVATLGATAVCLVLFHAYAASLVWAWHVAPALGLPVYGFKVFWGLSAIFAALFKAQQKDVEEKERTTTERVSILVGAALAPAFLILVAWVLK